jgi:predicted Zn finger-like uncharacterized protein
MVVKCSHCFGLMRVDDSRIPEAKPVKVRCPHCQGIGTVGPPAKQHEETLSVSEPLIAPPEPPQPQVDKKPQPEYRQELFDPLDDIRFPSDSALPEAPTRSRRKWLTVAVWGVASLAVIGFFALLVNLVLPGPRPSVRSTEQVQPANVTQPDGVLGVGSGHQKPRSK